MKQVALNFTMLIMTLSGGSLYAQTFNTTAYKAELNSISLGVREKKEISFIKTDTVYIEREVPKRDKPVMLDNKDIPMEILEYPSNENSFSLPLDDLIVQSNFGFRKHPVTGEWKEHNGIDLKANYENVKSVLTGTVIAAGWSKGNGNYLAIQTNNHILYYLHLEEYYFQTKETIQSGNIIGKSGSTGLSTAPHLHFAVKRDSQWIDPIDFLTELNNIYVTTNF